MIKQFTKTLILSLTLCLVSTYAQTQHDSVDDLTTFDFSKNTEANEFIKKYKKPLSQVFNPKNTDQLVIDMEVLAESKTAIVELLDSDEEKVSFAMAPDAYSAFNSDRFLIFRYKSLGQFGIFDIKSKQVVFFDKSETSIKDFLVETFKVEGTKDLLLLISEGDSKYDKNQITGQMTPKNSRSVAIIFGMKSVRVFKPKMVWVKEIASRFSADSFIFYQEDSDEVRSILSFVANDYLKGNETNLLFTSTGISFQSGTKE